MTSLKYLNSFNYDISIYILNGHYFGLKDYDTELYMKLLNTYLFFIVGTLLFKSDTNADIFDSHCAADYPFFPKNTQTY